GLLRTLVGSNANLSAFATEQQTSAAQRQQGCRSRLGNADTVAVAVEEGQRGGGKFPLVAAQIEDQNPVSAGFDIVIVLIASINECLEGWDAADFRDVHLL